MLQNRSSISNIFEQFLVLWESSRAMRNLHSASLLHWTDGWFSSRSAIHTSSGPIQLHFTLSVSVEIFFHQTHNKIRLFWPPVFFSWWLAFVWNPSISLSHENSFNFFFKKCSTDFMVLHIQIRQSICIRLFLLICKIPLCHDIVFFHHPTRCFSDLTCEEINVVSLRVSTYIFPIIAAILQLSIDAEEEKYYYTLYDFVQLPCLLNSSAFFFLRWN